MAESRCGKMSITPQSSKIPDFLAAMVGTYSNIQQAGMNLSYLQDPTNMAASRCHGNQKSVYNHVHQEDKRNKMAASCRHGTQRPGYDHPLYHHLHPTEWTGYHSYSALSQCLPIDHQDVPETPDYGRCSTPDIIQSVLQMDPHDVSPISKQQTPANHGSVKNERSPITSLNASIWRSPGGREYMDSGYLSEDSLSSFSSVFHTKPEKEQVQQIPAFPSSFFQALSQPNNQHLQTKPADLKHQKTVKAARRLQKYTVTSSLTTSSLPSFKYEPICPVQVAGVSSEGSTAPRQTPDICPAFIQSSQISTSVKPEVLKNSLKRKLSETDEQTTYSDAKRGRHNEPLNNLAVSVMTSWYNDHSENPYPNKEEKEKMAREGGIKVSQVKSWFANKRNRSNNTRPKVQKQQLQERLLTICQTLTKDQSPVMDNSFIIQQLSTLISSAQGR